MTLQVKPDVCQAHAVLRTVVSATHGCKDNSCRHFVDWRYNRTMGALTVTLHRVLCGRFYCCNRACFETCCFADLPRDSIAYLF